MLLTDRHLHWATWLTLLLIPLLYWGYTGHIWEDFFITFRQSANLVAGHGLTYHEGTRLHSFTSPLNVLVPAFFAWITGTTSFPLPLLLYTLFSLACLATGGWFTVRLLDAHRGSIPRAYSLVFAALLVLSVKVTAFTVNGQEAGFWVLFLAVSTVGVVRGYANAWPVVGFGWAGLMWSRPDSPIHIAAFGLAALLLPSGPRRAEMFGVLKAAAVCTVLYLPWILWAWWYYGTPIPHTVMAKSGAYGSEHFATMNFTQWFHFVGERFGDGFLPIYFRAEDWSLFLLPGMATCGLFALFAGFLLPDRILRLSSILFAVASAYLTWMDATGMVFPWYGVPPAFFGCLSLARGLQLLAVHTGASTTKNPVALRLSLIFVLGLLAILFVFSFVGSLRQIEVQQRVVENGVRKQVGLFLREHMQPDDRVFLEPIGYIGYFSNATILDYPGLVAPEVVRARREHGLTFLTLPAYLKPEWIVLRPSEFLAMKQLPGFHNDYQYIHTIDQRGVIEAIRWLPGRNYPLSDCTFHIFCRTSTEVSFSISFSR